MTRIYFGLTSFLLLSSWALAQVSAPPAGRNPTGATPSTSDRGTHAVEGCLTGADEVYKLRQSSGRTYELIGDPSVLADNVGHRVRLVAHPIEWRGASTSPEGLQGTWGVEKVEFVSSSCKMIPTVGDD